VAVVGQVPAAVVEDLGPADGPAVLDRGLPVVEEVRHDGASPHHLPPPPERQREPRAQLGETRQIEAAGRDVLLPPQRHEGLPPALGDGPHAQGLGQSGPGEIDGHGPRAPRRRRQHGGRKDTPRLSGCVRVFPLGCPGGSKRL
jgi:hypothetical protein